MDNVVPIIDDPNTQDVITGVGASQGFKGLAIRTGTQTIGLSDGREYIGQTIATAWRPNAEELAALNAGAAFYIEQNTSVVAPIIVSVGPVPERLDEGQEAFDFRRLF